MENKPRFGSKVIHDQVEASLCNKKSEDPHYSACIAEHRGTFNASLNMIITMESMNTPDRQLHIEAMLQ